MNICPAITDWHPIGQTNNQLILYHPPSHALSVQPHPSPPSPSSAAGPSRPPRPFQHRPLLLPYRSATPIETIPRPEERVSKPACPYCSQPLPPASLAPPFHQGPSGGYFQILERAHEGSRPPSPRLREGSPTTTPARNGTPFGQDDGDAEELPAKGYYERFFREECRLGIGAEGSVYLATHVIGGNVLGTYAVKKIAVGTSQSYLVKMLREVRLLETLRHPNIIPYHHSWIDLTRFSSFGPPIAALHVLMMYATAGNLDTFLITRAHSTQPSREERSAGGIADAESLGQLPKAERIKAFKKRRQSGLGNNAKREENRAVLLLGLEEILKLFGDVVEGLAFLHANSILHLDLKCSNVLLHWEEGKLIPKAMISDFGTSEEMLRGKRERTGHTGTMEYMAPETLVIDHTGLWRPSDSHADMWSLGMILHKLLFLHLPYTDTEDFTVLHSEILNYAGFFPSPDLVQSCRRRRVPRDLLVLLSKLVNTVPESRPSAEKVKLGLRGFDTRVPVGGLGGIVTRVTRPLGEFVRSSPPVGSQETWRDASPVRPVLALPSPEIEMLRPLVDERASGWTMSKYIRGALFTIKILSIQPSLSGITLPSTSAGLLVVLSLAGLWIDTWGYEVLSGIIHVGVIRSHGVERSCVL